MNTFFTSDTHFGHSNILRYDNSPFASIREQDNAIIHLWNARVEKSDKVFHLGDFAFGKQADIPYIQSITKRLNGKIHLIKGNHEKIALVPEISGRFESIESYREEHIDKQLFILFHYPIHEWNRCHRGSFHLHGHTHGNDSYDPRFRRMNVGIMNHGYTPVSLRQVVAKLSSKEVFSHHDL